MGVGEPEKAVLEIAKVLVKLDSSIACKRTLPHPAWKGDMASATKHTWRDTLTWLLANAVCVVVHFKGRLALLASHYLIPPNDSANLCRQKGRSAVAFPPRAPLQLMLIHLKPL